MIGLCMCAAISLGPVSPLPSFTRLLPKNSLIIAYLRSGQQARRYRCCDPGWSGARHGETRLGLHSARAAQTMVESASRMCLLFVDAGVAIQAVRRNMAIRPVRRNVAIRPVRRSLAIRPARRSIAIRAVGRSKDAGEQHA